MATGKVRRRSVLSFGVFLAAASIFPLFLGQEFWGSYLRLAGSVTVLQRLRGRGDPREGATKENRNFNDQSSPGASDFSGSQLDGSEDLFSSGGDLPSP